MAKLSMYSNPDESKQYMPWDFWTDEERSYVINQAYTEFFLKPEEIQPYLRRGRLLTLTNWIFPVVTLPLANYLFRSHIRMTNSYFRPVALTAAATLLWLNVSPFYTYKENETINVLDKLYERIGADVIALNDILPRSWTVSSIDKRTRRLHWQRNCFLTGYLFPGEDNMNPLRKANKAEKNRKKLYK